ncbi:transmembrane ascorbate-dependent reductase CYB561-like isoform X1 [Paramacrobiotus metropolitanus]|uniref:transmembrane ascorbate-dependent reductase CYB561-like isoform X1 n=1 Tax=Paramacrobiotus metropolitanus TaxID=2943436 RepID=UPI0024456380|nr:transmembrane ascorbate-dependent reductase CYB561-like isoform X1 [Paramacrobiotus metropolitanus]
MAEKEFLNMDSPLEHSAPNLKSFTFLVGTFEFLGLMAIILSAIWLGHYQGGFAWSEADPRREFNFHPLMMILAFCFIHGNANLAYRLLRGERKIRIKIIHAAMQLLAFIFMVIALQAVFDSHNNHRNSHGQPDPHPNMFSMHSWIGISTIVLYCCQWLTGFLFFLFPKVSLSLRRSYLPIHVFFGVLIHILFVSTALMGLTEAAIWNVKPDYHDKNGEAALVNILAIILVLFGLNGVYILINPNFKRQPRPDDDGAYIPRD